MYYYIVNPAAGGGMINSIQDKLKASLRSLKIDGEFAKTLGEGDASQVTRKAIDRGVKTIVGVGGNATINEIITTVFRQGKSDVAIGIIPTGKNNTLARSLDINNWRQACEVLASRRLVEYSLMTLNDHVFVQSLVISPPQPAEKDDESPKRWSKLLAGKTEFKPLAFRAVIDDNLRIRGQGGYMEIYNQKFLNSAYENQLLIQIYGDTPAKALAGRLGTLFAKSDNYQTGGNSQLHGKKLAIKSQRLAEANIDGRALSSKDFNITLTDWKLKLITNLTPTND